MKHLVLLLLLAVVGLSCISYSKKRARDFADIVSITFTESAGASAIIGPISLGIEGQTGEESFGLRGGYVATFDDSWSDWPIMTCIINVPDTSPAPNDQLRAKDQETQCLLKSRNKAYNRNDPLPFYRYGSIGLSAGVGFMGIRVEINFLEMIDFLAGIITADPLNDDTWAEEKAYFRTPTEACQDPLRPKGRLKVE